MPVRPRFTVLTTVGVSLKSNLDAMTEYSQSVCQEPAVPGGGAAQDEHLLRELVAAYQNQDWVRVGRLLRGVDPTKRLCGAEINSTTDLLQLGYVDRGSLQLLCSDTPDGRAMAQALREYFVGDRWQVEVRFVEGLRDDEPRLFRTRGLRDLVREMGNIFRERGKESCAINATGGYKAQIAIAVLLGQALQVPVYYKFERFSEIVPFPGMPVALDFRLWLEHNDLFSVLGRGAEVAPWQMFRDRWDERLETLVDRETVDGVEYVALNATGQIFHEALRDEFSRRGAAQLPPPAARKGRPILGDEGFAQAATPIRTYMETIIRDVPYVHACRTIYWNPDLPERSRFAYSQDQILGIYSNGNWCVKFLVLTTAESPEQRRAAVGGLNDWLDARGGAG